MKGERKFAIGVGLILIFLVGWGIFHQIQENHLRDDPKLNDIEEEFRKFFSQENYWEAPLSSLNNRDIMNEISIYRGNKSYTINKEKVYLCMKDEEGQYWPDNTLKYVLAHEISHTLSESIGHTEEFHKIFEALLVKMAEKGLYNPSLPINKGYCANGDPEV